MTATYMLMARPLDLICKLVGPCRLVRHHGQRAGDALKVWGMLLYRVCSHALGGRAFAG